MNKIEEIEVSKEGEIIVKERKNLKIIAILNRKDRKKMTGYIKSISEITGITNIAQLELIEDCMRHDVFHSTLDWQTAEQFRDGALVAVDVLKEMGEL